LATNLSLGTGRRKTAIARVYIREGNGEIIVNGKDLDTYFSNPILSIIVKQPYEVTSTSGKYKTFIRVKGGGLSGQAGACKHGIARALSVLDSSNHSTLHANGYLTRDPRMVERKKYGRRGARRRFQFSKR
jgi:small subunit ribosomal protein S9